MKVIDLLNKIANGEEVPEEILFCESEKYIYDNQIEDYRSSTYDSYCLFRSYVFDHPDRQSRLNKKVEIIEPQEHKIPEKLKIEQDTPNSNFYIRNEYGTKCALTKHSKIIADKINEILDYLEKIE